MLVNLRYKDRDNEKIQEVFIGGINQREYKEDGDIAFMENMSSLSYPVLKPRGKRMKVISSDGEITGLSSGNELCYTKDKGDGTAEFYYGGEKVEGLTLTAGEKSFVTLGDFIIIHPDMKYYFTGKVDGVYEDGTYYYKPDNKEVTADALWLLNNDTKYQKIAEGAYYEAAGAIYRYNSGGSFESKRYPSVQGIDHYKYVRLEQAKNPEAKWLYQCSRYGSFAARDEFENDDDMSAKAVDNKVQLTFDFRYRELSGIKVGDSLKIICESEDSVTGEYGAIFTAYTRVEKMEYSKDTKLHTWTLSYVEDLTSNIGDSDKLIIEREYPVLDGIFECNMRLWGYKGDSIYASALGNPFAFNVYTTELDGYSIDTETSGKLTAGCNFAGYPTFFKEDYIFRITGGTPSDFCLSITPSPSFGCTDSRSIQCFGTKMIYLSPSGFVLYQGALPSPISEALEKEFMSAITGFDGRMYYATAKAKTGEINVYVFDTENGVWFREDGREFFAYTYFDNVLYAATTDGIYALGEHSLTSGTPEEEVNSFVEFAPFNEVYLEKKVLKKIALRYKTEKGSSLRILKKQGKEWILKKEIPESSEGTSLLQIMPRRGDSYSLRIEGTGEYVIYALSREYALRSKR